MTTWKRAELEALRHSRPAALFIDDGGVLNDNALRAPEWSRLIGEFMPPRLGGTPDTWARANREVFPAIWPDLVRQLPTAETHGDFQRAYAISWVRAMCERMGIEAPPDERAIALHRELSVYVAERAESAIPGAREAVLALHGAGYQLYTGSGTPSAELRGIMRKMRLGGAFSTLYGPDIVDRVKYGPRFYETIFAHAPVPADDALVIESDPECCRWAVEAGARAIWVAPKGDGDAPSLASLVPYLT